MMVFTNEITTKGSRDASFKSFDLLNVQKVQNMFHMNSVVHTWDAIENDMKTSYSAYQL